MVCLDDAIVSFEGSAQVGLDVFPVGSVAGWSYEVHFSEPFSLTCQEHLSYDGSEVFLKSEFEENFFTSSSALPNHIRAVVKFDVSDFEGLTYKRERHYKQNER